MEKHYDPLLRDTLYTEKLENGLTIAVLHRPEYRQVTGRIATQYGSIDSRFRDPQSGEEVHVPDGIAHFLEHKLFEKEWGNVSDKFSALGAEANAYTTYTNTVYYFSTIQNVEPCMELLLDFVQTPWFTDESVVKEQGIIDQEIRMYLDDAGWRSSANLLEALYVNHPARIDIAGTVESIRQITKETLYQCHRTFYHPSNMVLFVAGPMEPELLVSMARESFARHEYAPQSTIERIMPDEPTQVHQRRRSEKLVVSQPILRLGFKDQVVGLTGRQLLEQNLQTGIILDAIAGRGSELYTTLYESGLIDHRFGFEYSPEETYGYTYFSGPTRDPSELEIRLLDGLQTAAQRGITEADFERARKKSIGNVVSFMNDLDAVAFVFIDGCFKEIGLFDWLPTAAGLTLEGANQRLREHFDPRHVAVSVIYPK